MLLRNSDGTIRPTQAHVKRARLIVSGTGASRTHTDLVDEVARALASAYESGLLDGERTSAAAPKLGAVYALESARSALDRTIVELRKDIES